jgi:D-alanyl-D-alanine carboxypeptidase
MDAGSGKVLFGQDENKVIYPASTAKLMTAIVCIENGDVNSKIKTSREVLDGVTYGTYCLGLESGVSFTFKDLLSLSLISSAADATDSLAVGVFGSREKCVEAMNEKVKELGLKKTCFDNPVGSDIGAGFENTYATATEMALITRYAQAVPLIRSTVRKSHYDTTSGQDISATSTNWFIRGIIPYDTDIYRVIGSKSGTTNAAGNVFIATAVDDYGHEVICAYFGNAGKESTFAGIRKLLNYTFNKVDEGKIKLYPKCEDIRASSMRELYDTYVALDAYPTSSDGCFYPKKPLTRTQLARLIKNVVACYGDPGLGSTAKRFAGENKDGYVTAAKAAEFIQEIYPSHINDEEVEKILSDCSGTEYLNDQEKEAYAIFIKNKFVPNKKCKNARHLLTRKEALVLADRLSDYQIDYAANHLFGKPSLLLTGDLSVDLPAVKPDAIKNKEAGVPASSWNLKWRRHYKKEAASKL